jgi:hypothetical protein
LPARGAASLEVDVGKIDGAGWHARAVSLTLTLQDTGALAGAVTVRALVLPEPVGTIADLRISCGRIGLTHERLRCDTARLEPGNLPFGLSAMAGWLEYRAGDRRLDMQLVGVDNDGGRLTVAGHASDSSWRFEVTADALQLGPWAAAVRRARNVPSGARSSGRTAQAEATRTTEPGEQAAQGDLTGRLDLRMVATGGDAAAEAEFEGQVGELSAYNAAGTTAAEGLMLQLSGRVVADARETRFETRITVPAGEVYQEPVYLNLGLHPLDIELAGRSDAGRVELHDVRLRQPDVLTGHGSASFQQADDGSWQVTEAALKLEQLTLPGAYDVLLQPVLANTDLANLETTGSLSGELRMADDAIIAAALEIRDVYLDDRDGRLAAYGLNADLVWAAGAGAQPLAIRWDGGFIYGIAYGAARLDFQPEGRGWALVRPVAIPVLDGALEIGVLEFGGMAEGATSISFDARLTPLDMRSLARALDWPPLSGTLAGEIPSLSYENGEISLAGALEARMFDGSVTVADLSVREPFSDRALLRADIDMRGLDLRLVTEAFSFGLITGRLDGYVHDLVMIGWSPAAFDARLYTSPDDRTRHRISQRAVDNIASLGGGGGAAALSSGFLRFFDEFTYDRISLGCRLDRKVCAMSGIEPSGNGYLILRGSGLPQINVVGFARRVNWPTMVAQLKSIVESEGPVIE